MLLSSALTIIIIAGGLALFSQSGYAPGLDNGQLSACPDKPNCSCSEYPDDADHYISPINLSAEQYDDAMTAIKISVQTLGGQIQHLEQDYLASTFSSSLFGFVDDLEIRIDPKQNQIHIRSAARVGYSDFSVNKKRVVALKDIIEHHLNTKIGTPSDQ
jgi:uncharacterized protein (DUF1499 family)